MWQVASEAALGQKRRIVFMMSSGDGLLKEMIELVTELRNVGIRAYRSGIPMFVSLWIIRIRLFPVPYYICD